MFIRFCIIESSGVQRDAPPPLVYAPVDKRTGPADVKRVTSGPKGLEQAHIGGRRGQSLKGLFFLRKDLFSLMRAQHYPELPSNIVAMVI